MSDIIVDTYKLRDYAQRIEAVNKMIIDVDDRLNALYFRVNILDLLNILISDIYISSSDKLLKCTEYLKATAEDFDSAEEYIKNPTKEEWESVATVQLPTSRSIKMPSIKDVSSKMLETFGLTGSLVAWAINSDSGEGIFKSMLKVSEKAIKAGANIFDGKLVDLFGVSKTVDAIGFRENLAFQFDKYKINNTYNISNSSVAQRNASKLSATIKWMGVAVSGMINFKNNADEYNYDFKNPRMWVETGLETAWDVGKGILVGALAATVVGASAPAWAAGLVAVGVGAVVDTFIDKEKVVDFVVDAGTAIVKTGAKVVEKAGTAIKKTGEAVAKTVKTTVENVGKAVKKTGQAVAKTVEKAGQAISKAVEKTKQAVSNTVSKVTSTAKTIATNAVKTVGNAVKSAKNTVKAAWNGITKIGKGLSGLFA